MTNQFIQNLKEKLRNMDNKAHEWKGRNEQKYHDSQPDDEANDTY